MYRCATSQIVSRRRLFSSSSAAATTDELFIEAWKRVATPPKTPLTFAQPRSTPTTTPSKLTLNFISPYSSHFSNKQRTRYPLTGQMGVLPGHVPSISELKPGILSIHEGSQVTKYFISSGFAYVHSNSITDVLAVEAVPIEQIDPVSVENALAEFTRKLSTAITDL